MGYAAEQVESALRQLWAHVPLTGHAIEQWGRSLVWALGDVPPRVVPERLEMLLNPFLDDDKVGALAAALGLHPDVRPDGTREDRHNEYAQLICEPGTEPLSSRTMFEWAKEGSKTFAEEIVGGLVRDKQRWKLDVRLTGTAEQLAAEVSVSDIDAALTPLELTFDSKQLTGLVELEHGTIEYSPELAEILNDGRLEERIPNSSLLTGRLDRRGRARLEISWVAAKPPQVSVSSLLSFPHNVSVEAYNDSLEVIIGPIVSEPVPPPTGTPDTVWVWE